MALLRKRGRLVSLNVVGDGPDVARLRKLAAAEGVSESVVFHGRMADEALRSLYSSCDLFVLPSGGEGFGIVYLEAMAYARPVIAADAGGAPSVVRPGQSGWLVPYGDPAALAESICARLDDPEGSRSVGLQGRRLVESEFSFGTFVDKVRLLAAAGAS